MAPVYLTCKEPNLFGSNDVDTKWSEIPDLLGVVAKTFAPRENIVGQMIEQSATPICPAVSWIEEDRSYTYKLRAGPGCLDSAPLDLSGFLPGYAERG
ncbi:hypothetical protein, partial [Bradyrhizobium sp. Mp19]|uniref:hypothetical protein n=1 Tax=Bradyrhizobium sp. Mp19 TaxID=3042156 RepID=UPI002484D8BB